MIGASEDDRQYRRGMVLGLTMAEIMLLLIFLLLLILAARLFEEQKIAKAYLEQRDKAIAEKAELERKVADLEPLLEQLRRVNAKEFDITKEYQKAKEEAEAAKKELQEAKSAMEILEEITKDKPDLSKEAAAREAQRLAELGREMEQESARMFPEVSAEEAVDEMTKTAEVGKQVLASGKSPDELIAGAACQSTLDQCKKGNRDLANQLAKKGGTLPSCWIDGAKGGKPQYIFTATLRDDGIYLSDNHVPGREADQSALPIAPLQFDRAYRAPEFVADGSNLFHWSDRQDPPCRFYVRLVDDTSNDKALYKNLKEKGVERVFFTLPTN